MPVPAGKLSLRQIKGMAVKAVRFPFLLLAAILASFVRDGGAFFILGAYMGAAIVSGCSLFKEDKKARFAAMFVFAVVMGLLFWMTANFTGRVMSGIPTLFDSIPPAWVPVFAWLATFLLFSAGFLVRLFWQKKAGGEALDSLLFLILSIIQLRTVAIIGVVLLGVFFEN